MISVNDASDIVLATLFDSKPEQVPLAEAEGRVLQEDLHAERDFPPFDRVTMDGIAIPFARFQAGARRFIIDGTQAAGAPKGRLQDPEGCLEVMTGAILPGGVDTVIRYEDLEIQAGYAEVQIEEVKSRQNVHAQGYDRQAGELIVPAGQRISPAEIGVAATIGKADLLVSALPSVVIISTGDELVDVEETPLPHQIRTSNVHTLKSALGRWGIKAVHRHLPDDLERTRIGLAECLERFDVLILSGGVSKGKFDYVPQAMEDLEVDRLFHKIRQRPGKPFWFGKAASGTIVFALPGNPVSSFMCLTRYFMPWLRKSLGLEPFAYAFAELAKPVHFKPELTYFMQVQVAFDRDGRMLAVPVEGHGSGDLANLTDADGFLELPPDRTDFPAGEVFPLLLYRNLFL